MVTYIRDETIKEKVRMTFIDHFTCITEIYTIPATKYVSRYLYLKQYNKRTIWE